MADITKTQPTILVKKADGTSERITLAEFRLRKIVNSSEPIANRSIPEAQTNVKDERLKIEDQRMEKLQPSQSVRRVIPLVEETEEQRLASSDRRTVIRNQGISEPQKSSPSTPSALLRTSSVRRPIPLVEETDEQRESRTTYHVPQIAKRRVIPLVEETEIIKSAVPAVRGESHITNTTPVARVFNHQSPITSHQSPPTDTRSLLDDDYDEITALAKKHNTTHSPVTSVSFSSSVMIPESLEARTNSLILSWKKGIRDKHQFLLYAIRRVADGGLGLTQVNAEKLFLEISENAVLGTPTVPPRPASRPMTPVSGMPASTIQKKPALQQIPNSTSLIREIAPTHETSSVMGPVEEAGALTLEDFKRLSRNPKTAGSMLVAKFNGWKDESYLLYLQIRDSWKQSPLFRLYIEHTVNAIEKNVPIVSVLQGNLMNYEEYLAIIEVNRMLNMMN